MAMNIQERSGGFQLRIIHKLLPRPFFHTFDSRIEAESYGNLLKASLARGTVPADVLAKLNPPKRANDSTVLELLVDYRTNNASISRTDDKDTGYLEKEFVAERVSDIDFDFISAFTKRLRLRPMAPSTIRARIGLLGRVWDFHHSKTKAENIANPWRKLPEGYSVANEAEQKLIIAAGKEVKRDQERDRRLEPGEEDRIERVLAGEKFLEDRERALQPNPELRTMFRCLLSLGGRMREVYMLTRGQVDFPKGVVHLNGTKGHRDARKPRDVPMRRAIRATLKEWIDQLPEGENRLFPSYWSGTSDKDELEKVSNNVSKALAVVYEHAMCEGLRTHDVRHEATCRWVLLERADGRYALERDMVVKIMGWTSPTMIKRYLSLRGEDLAAIVGDL